MHDCNCARLASIRIPSPVRRSPWPQASEGRPALPRASLPGPAPCYKLRHDRCHSGRRASVCSGPIALRPARPSRRPARGGASRSRPPRSGSGRRTPSSSRAGGSRTADESRTPTRASPRVRACCATATASSRPRRLRDRGEHDRPAAPRRGHDGEPAAPARPRVSATVTLPPVAVSDLPGARRRPRRRRSRPRRPRTRRAARPPTRSRSARASVGSGPSRPRPGRRRPHSRQYSCRRGERAPQRGQRDVSALTPRCPRRPLRRRRARGRSSGRTGRRSGSARRTCRSPAAAGGGRAPASERVDLARRAPRSRRARRSARRRAPR